MTMHMIKLTLLAALLSPPLAFAGPHGDDLSKCLVEKTTQEDRMALVKWVFSAASAHPAVKGLTSVSAQQLDDANKATAELFMKLLTESCRSEAENALQDEGVTTLQASFQVLGLVAGQELFSSPEVSVAMSGLQKYVDSQKLESLINRSK
jgi:hypothetical protein